MYKGKISLLKNNIDYIILTLTVLLASTLFFLTLYYSQYGFDISDEGFYINSIAFPNLYHENFTLFGFIYHLLFKLLNQNWILLRKINILLIFSLSFILSFVVFNQLFINKNIRNLNLVILSFAVATLSFLYLTSFNWLISPSYNSLNFIGCLVCSLGIVPLNKELKNHFNMNLFLIAFGGYLVFMSKVSSAFGLGILVLLFSLLTKKINIKQLVIACLYFIILLVVSIFFIDHSIETFGNRILKAIHWYRLLVTNSVFRLDFFIPQPADSNTLIILMYFILNYYFYLGFNNINHWKRFNGILSFAYLFFICKILWSYFYQHQTYLFRLQEIDLLYFSIFSLFSIMIIFLENDRKNINQNNLYIGLFFLFLPYAYAFGTSNPYWYQEQMSGMFWILSSICFLASLPFKEYEINKKFGPLLLLALSLLLIFYFRALHYPYRQPDIIKKQSKLMNFNQYSKIYVSQDLKKCVINLRAKIFSKISKKPVALVDLTGKSPGLVYLIHALPVGAPWLTSGYKHSDDFIYHYTNDILKKRTSPAYILINESMSQAQQLETIKKLNINLSQDYTQVIEQKCDLSAYGFEKNIFYIYQVNKHINL